MYGITSARSAHWVVLRAALLLLAALPTSLIVACVHASYASASAWLMPSMIGSALAVTCFALQYQRMIPRRATHWRSPSWFENPLSPHQPLQWSVLIGEALMLSGVGCAAIDTLSAPYHCSWEIPVAAGMGVWLGTFLYGALWMPRVRR